MGVRNKIIAVVVAATIAAWAIYQYSISTIKKDIESYYIALETMAQKVKTSGFLTESSSMPIKEKIKDLRDSFQLWSDLADNFIPKTKILKEIHKHYIDSMKLNSEHYEVFYDAIDTGKFINVRKTDDSTYKWNMRRYVIQGVGLVSDGQDKADIVHDSGRRAGEELKLWQNKLKDLSAEYGLSERYENHFNGENDENGQPFIHFYRDALVFPREPLPKAEVARILPYYMCDKMIECAPHGGPSRDDCEKVLTTQVLEGKNGQPFPTVTRFQLGACVVSLGNWTCRQMQTSPKPPTGCEFLVKK